MRTFTDLFKIYQTKKTLETIKIGYSTLIIIDCQTISYLALKNLYLISESQEGIIIFVNILEELYSAKIDLFFDFIICFNFGREK